MRSLVRRAAVGAAAFALVATVAACGPVRVGAAAIVGDHRISTSTVDAAAQEVSKNSPEGIQQSNQPPQVSVPTGITVAKVYGLLVKDLAEREGIGYTQADIDKLIDRNTRGQGLSDDKVYAVQLLNGWQVQMPGADVEEHAVTEYLVGELLKRYGGDERALQRPLIEIAQSEGVEVSPRYGRFDEKSAVVVPSYGGLWSPSKGGR